jgi:tetratricopeptide (TPR) repeat protein
MADLLGWLYQDSGDFQASQYWMATALESAHLAEDQDSVVFVLARKSQLTGDMHEGAEAVEIAEAAMKLARRRSRLWAVAATYAAHGYALCRDRASCDRLYDQALSSLDQAERDDSPWEPTFFDASYMLVQRARSLDILGDHGKAAHGFRGALDSLKPGYHRDRGVYVAREALAYARTKEPEHAAMLGIQALTVGVDTHSSRIFTELASVNEALVPWQDMPEVANFQSEVTAALGRKA